MHGSSARELTSAWRSTWQRSAVLRALTGCPDFVSARALHAALAAGGTTVGLTTVYRTLRKLEHAGQVDVVRDKTGERLYRPRPDDGHRHYVVCRRCGLSRAVEADPVERWADDVAAETGFAEVEHTVELTGICDRCLPTPGRGTSRP
ncbi:transcriptional repressor [Streptomyces sp. SID8361]|uniref:Fur family transcriptional regulator n=1 Tax=Streptomyces TaxID=1883 RepID=UPI00081F0357|nr:MULTISPECIES: transcriptional repressor [unclassified Streptomyces]AUA17026.1 Zinc uptake regulation protein [Streptomyces sp. M56]MYU10955.1 transcriptional repressor [Streptomyces sp. SID8361]MYX56190.1 transcriptional repressor [Streptomyces sp. SID8382]SCF76822.1 Fur family transcriptional regulator, ferric uptake regulator [Streptomyces sp. MnatMP-M27]